MRDNYVGNITVAIQWAFPRSNQRPAAGSKESKDMIETDRKFLTRFIVH